MSGIWLALLIVSLGLDTLAVSVGLGLSGVRGRLRIAAVFGIAEGVMAAVGILLGIGLGRVVGHAASLVGGGVLVLLAIYLLIREAGPEDSDAERTPPSHLSGLTLWSFAAAISVDELAVGVSVGLTGLGLGLAAVVAAEAFCFAGIGLTFGARLARFAGSLADRLAAWVLLLLGIWTLFRAVFGG